MFSKKWKFKEEDMKLIKRGKRLLKKVKIFGKEAHIYGRKNSKRFLVFFPETGELGLLWRDGGYFLTSVALLEDGRFWYSYANVFDDKGIVATSDELEPIYKSLVQ